MKNDILKPLYWITILFLFIVCDISVVAQKKISKLTNFAGRDYWIVEKNGLKGLKSKKEGIVVPVEYDLALPAVQPEFSFIIKNGNLGLYDNKMQKELVVEENHAIMNLYEGYDESTYVLVFGDVNDYFGNEPVYYILKRDSLDVITSVKEEYSDYNLLVKLENGLEKAGNSIIIHRFSLILSNKDSDGNEEVNSRKSIQKTGVYSLDLNKFIVPSEFVNFYQSFDYDAYESIAYYDFYQAVKIDSDLEFIAGYGPQLYSLYSMDFKELVAPKPEISWPMQDGGFFRRTQTDSLVVFSDKGELILSIPDVKADPVSVNMVGDLVYLGNYYDDDYVNDEMNMNLKEYHIYTRKGELITTKKFDVDLSADSQSVRLITIQDPNDEWSFLTGFFDIEKVEMVIEPVYSYIVKIDFKDGIIKCDVGNCSYYFLLKKGDEYDYIDQEFKPFTPQPAISGSIFENYMIDMFYSMSPEEMNDYIGVYPIDTSNSDYDFFKKQGMDVTIEITDYELFSMDPYVGISYDTYQNVEIVEMYDYYAAKDKKLIATYGLINKSRDRLYLPPFFDKIEFNRQNNTLEFTYKGESGSILLERYE